jgi:pimeloyl-ACP methyl ester carboxylesterase
MLERADGPALAYRHVSGEGPTVVFLPGFRSDMESSKALALYAHCRMAGRAMLRLDYSGHGASQGRFEEGDIGQWTADALAVIDAVTQGPLILVGSSMGGWIALLVALARREWVAGLIGIAAAPDFTQDLMWHSYSQEIRREIMEKGVYLEPSDYGEPLPVTRRLIEDGRRHLLLDKPIPLTCPVHLIQGMRDPDVPWGTAMRILEQLASDDVELTLVKAGDHRLSEPHDLARLTAAVDRMVERARS